MSHNPYTHDLLWRALNRIASGDDDVEALTAQFREAFLALGSETECNLNCVDRIEIDVADSETGPKIGPVLRGHSLSEIAHVLESEPMPEAVRTAFPELTDRDWDAFGRLTTLLYIALSRHVASAD